MENWVMFTFLDAIYKGFFECAKKKASEKNSIYDVLAWFSLIAFLLVALTSKNVFSVDLSNLFIIFVKTLIVMMAWLLGIYGLSKMPISLYSVIYLSRIIFSVILSLVFLGEKLTITVLTGIIIVLIGLILVNRSSNKAEYKETSLKLIVVVLISCLLNSISSVLDKKILENITSGQLQFWFLLFLTIFYWLILLIKQRKINLKAIKKNYWIPVIAICLIIGDRFLFIANEIPESKVSIMIIIKQFTAIESIILGKLVFKEKNIIKKLVYSILIIFGIILTLV